MKSGWKDFKSWKASKKGTNLLAESKALATEGLSILIGSGSTEKSEVVTKVVRAKNLIRYISHLLEEADEMYCLSLGIDGLGTDAEKFKAIINNILEVTSTMIKELQEGLTSVEGVKADAVPQPEIKDPAQSAPEEVETSETDIEAEESVATEPTAPVVSAPRTSLI